MEGITLKIVLQYNEIDEVKQNEDKTHTKIIFKSGDKLTIDGKQGKRVFKSLMRNFPGEHLD